MRRKQPGSHEPHQISDNSTVNLPRLRCRQRSATVFGGYHKYNVPVSQVRGTVTKVNAHAAAKLHFTTLKIRAGMTFIKDACWGTHSWMVGVCRSEGAKCRLHVLWCSQTCFFSPPIGTCIRSVIALLSCCLSSRQRGGNVRRHYGD